MSTEQYANTPTTTLTGAISPSATTLTVANGSTFPSQPQFRIRIDTELLLVTALTGTTWTVTRGIEGTTAAGHSAGAAVTHILTAAGLANFPVTGDGTGTISDITVTGLQNNPITASTPSTVGEVPAWSGSAFVFRQLTADDLGTAFSIGLSSASGGSGAIEVGSTWTPTFNVSYSPNSTGLTASTINDTSSGSANILGVNNPVNPPSTSYTKTTVDSSESVSVTATRSGVTKTSNGVGVTWEPKCWYGVGTAGATGVNGTTGVLAGATGTLTGQLQASRGTTFTVSPSSQKVYFAVPVSYGSITAHDSNGFLFAFNSPTVITVVNQYSVSLSYNLYESTNALGVSYTITIS